MSANTFKVGEVWHYRFQVAGQRVQRSTRLKNRRAAELLRQRLDAFNALPWYRRVWTTIWRDV